MLTRVFSLSTIGIRFDMKLVIVESPTKCETIKRYLGNDYLVVASKGHICDLSTKGERGLGVDIQNGFTPTYVVSKKQISMVKELKAEARKSSEVILATDPDREGEAIAWHLARELNLPIETTKRLEFHEITRDSINKAIQEPRTIDMDLVYSQEARRIIDRIIGFDLSGLIKKRIGSKSAGRVQSSTLNLIAEHDEEITKFIPKEYYEILGKTKINKEEYSLNACRVDNKKINISSKEEANKIFSNLSDDVTVTSVKRKVYKVESKEPFTTSSMQQEAFNKYKFSASKTLKIAQSLYEGLNVNGEHMGLITYMRTDSNRLSPTFVNRAHAFIIERYGEEYLGKAKGHFKELKLAQDGHEGIRPTKNHNTPESVKQYLKPEQYNLYKLIYNRAVGSLMKAKTEEKLTLTLLSGNVEFELDFVRTLDPGFEILEGKVKKEEFPEIKENDKFPLFDKSVEQKFTQPPAHYSEAKVVQLMEEKGIGRPSTYAATIETLKDRMYVIENGGLLSITSQGILTNNTLNKYFPDIVDVQYTADMELLLDEIASGNADEVEVLSDFYKKFRSEYHEASDKMKHEEAEVFKDYKCPVCGSDLIYAVGKNGRYIKCSNKKCKHTESDPNNELNKGVLTKKKCEKCGAYLLKKKGQYGVYYVCSNSPTCDYKISAKLLLRKKTSYKKN